MSSEMQLLSGTKHVGYSSTVNVVAGKPADDDPVSPTNLSVAAADDKLLELDITRQTQIKALTAACVFCFFFMICEIVGGYISHSLAILTDATHLMTDVGAYALSIFALHAASRKACNKYSFGWHRAEVLGTLASVFMIWALVGAIVVEALSRVWSIVDCANLGAAAMAAATAASDVPTSRRMAMPKGTHRPLTHPTNSSGLPLAPFAVPSSCTEIDARMMIVIGVLGMVVNVVCASILHFGGSHGHSHFGGGTCGGGHDHGHGGHDDHDDHRGHSHDSHHHDDPDEDHHGHAHDDHHEDHGHAHGAHGCQHDAPREPEAARVHFTLPRPESNEDVLNNSYHTEDEFAMDSPNTPGGHHAAGGFAINAAFLHALGDCVQSAGVIFAGAFIYLANLRAFGTPSSATSIYNLADPLSSIFFAVVTLHMTRHLIFDILAILMESTPPNIDVEALTKALSAIQGVVSVHDLHVWSLAANYPSLSVHLVSSNHVEALHAAQVICEKRFGITHTTIQVDAVEHGSDRCGATC